LEEIVRIHIVEALYVCVGGSNGHRRNGREAGEMEEMKKRGKKEEGRG
jgi:hypothetical protein